MSTQITDIQPIDFVVTAIHGDLVCQCGKPATHIGRSINALGLSDWVGLCTAHATDSVR